MIGDQVHIEGGVHFHSEQSQTGDQQQPEAEAAADDTFEQVEPSFEAPSQDIEIGYLQEAISEALGENGSDLNAEFFSRIFCLAPFLLLLLYWDVGALFYTTNSSKVPA